MTVQASELAGSDDVYRQMTALVFSHWLMQTVRAVADLSVADHLADGPLTAADLAERENCAAGSTWRVMRAGVAAGLLKVDESKRFSGTSLLQTLRKDDPRSLRPLALTMGRPQNWAPWTTFLSSVREGTPQVHAALGMDMFEYMERHPDLAEEFSAGMRSLTALWGPAIAQMIDTTDVECAVDIGGGNGSMLHLLQQTDPALQGIIFDRPNVAEQTKKELARSSFADRTTVVGGDFFDSVPAGDLYLLKFVLHDWSDEECIAILRRCRAAMKPGGRIAIIELLVSDDSVIAALWDINMMALTTGRERSVEEFDALLTAADLRRTSVLDTGVPQGVIEATAK
jgi:hypothetical protein